MGSDRQDTVRTLGTIPIDIPLLFLLLVNAATIVLALTEGWDLGVLLFVYWSQSVIIGFFTAIRILTLRSDQIVWEGRFAEGYPVQEVKPAFDLGKVLIAGFFVVHYGLFHWGYYTFLTDLGFINMDTILGNADILLACGLFFINHLISFLYYRKKDQIGPENLKNLFLTPYVRIIPMHVTIIIGGFASFFLAILGIDATGAVLILFLSLKTYVDIRMHIEKHAGRKVPDPAPVASVGAGMPDR
jgi:hypothetical protein